MGSIRQIDILAAIRGMEDKKRNELKGVHKEGEWWIGYWNGFVEALAEMEEWAEAE